jgi:pimeloyl-ACP methyl ester carboxylesterase
MNQDLLMSEGRHLPAVGSIVRYRTVKGGEIKIFYWEAGPQDGPALLLLHGFPAASHMFRDLIPRLADHFRPIAPTCLASGQAILPLRHTSWRSLLR